jgi:hypothetical protein
VYRKRFSIQGELRGQRIFLEAPVVDDVLEVLVNGERAGVCLWAPYVVEITPLLRAGENGVEVRVANTLINLLEGVARPSGLCGVPRLVGCREFRVDAPVVTP